MWHHAESRTSDIKGAKGFALPGATRHYAPDRQAQVSRIVIEIWIERTRPRIRGCVKIALSALSPVSRLDLDARELEIERVRDGGGQALPHELEDGHLSVKLAKPLAAGESLELIVDYAGEPRRGIYFIGPSAFDPERPLEVWTQGQDEDSRHWFPCFDYPNQKAATEVIAHVAPGLLALSNGRLVEKRESIEEHVWHYRQDLPHSTYLVTLVVGDYAAIEHARTPVPVTSYVHPQQLAQGRLTFSRTADMVELFSRKIGIPYPFPSYAQICVADFIFGGMENTTATTLTEQILFDDRSEEDYRRVAEALIAHELAHQWWGDLVTCAEWSHAWLNEGFATYFETVWREHVDGAAEAAYARFIDQEAYFHESYRRPLVERTFEEPIDLFDRHQYEKGACVLHLMRFMLGDADFWRVLQRYGEANRGDVVKTSDLERAILDVTGKNFESMLDQWVYAPGHPHVAISGSWDAEEGVFNLSVEQTQRGDRVPDAFVFPADIEVVTEDGAEVHRARIETRKQTIRLPSPKRPLYVVFDKGGHVLKQLDNRLSSAMLRALLERSDDVHALILAARTLVKRGEPQSLRAVLRAASSHALPAVRAEAAKALRRAGGEEVKTGLLEAATKDADPRVRRAALRSLSHFRDHAAEIARVLADAARRERSDYAIAEALRTVAELRAPGARAFLDEGLARTGHNHTIRAAAIDALTKLRDVSALPVIAEHTKPAQHTRVREAAVAALGTLARYTREGSVEHEEARERLVECLDDPWLRVRIRAAEALKTLGDRGILGELRERADRELDGRARRAMRLAERELREAHGGAEELDRLRDEVRVLEQSHAKLSERLERLEARRTRSSTSEAARAKKRKKKDRGKKRS